MQKKKSVPEEGMVGGGMSPIAQVLLVFGILMVFLLVSKLYLDQYLDMRKLEGKLQAEEARKNEYKAKIRELKADVALLKSDAGAELLARDRLKLLKPDEVLVVPVE